MSTEPIELDARTDEERRQPTFFFDRHTPEYREHRDELTAEMHQKCPVAWSDTYGGHWIASGHEEVLSIARRADVMSNHRDTTGERPEFQGIRIPTAGNTRSGFVEMDPPEQRHYRQTLNPYLSPAAVTRWTPFVDDVVRACLDEHIERGSIDFVDDLANVVPAVLTLAMMGLPIEDWKIYAEPAHALVYMPPDSPDMPRVLEQAAEMVTSLHEAIIEVRDTPRPGMIDALVRCTIDGETPNDDEIADNLALVIAAGFDTTTALIAHALEYLSENHADRTRLSEERDALLDTATEEFLRYFSPVPGDGRTFSGDAEIAGISFKEGERLWLSWSMANRDPRMFPNPNEIDLERESNRHCAFGLSIHRCIGSNMARMTFKRMLVAVLDRMPDFVCDPENTVHFPTIGVVQGMRQLPSSFTPGPRLGAGIDETLAAWQRKIDAEGLGESVTGRA